METQRRNVSPPRVGEGASVVDRIARPGAAPRSERLGTARSHIPVVLQDTEQRLDGLLQVAGRDAGMARQRKLNYEADPAGIPSPAAACSVPEGTVGSDRPGLGHERSQKISGHQGALPGWKIMSALAAAPGISSCTRNARASRVQVKPPR